MRLILSLLFLLLNNPLHAWDVVVGGGMTRATLTTDFENDVVSIKEYGIQHDNNVKLFARWNFTPYFGVQGEVSHYGDSESSEVQTSTINNVVSQATINVQSEITARSISFFIGADPAEWIGMYGKFGYAQYENTIFAEVIDNTNANTQVFLQDETINDSAPLLGLGFSIALPWDVVLLAEVEIINGNAQEIESFNVMAEYRF